MLCFRAAVAQLCRAHRKRAAPSGSGVVPVPSVADCSDSVLSDTGKRPCRVPLFAKSGKGKTHKSLPHAGR